MIRLLLHRRDPAHTVSAMNTGPLAGKKLVVIGGTTGLGFSAARTFVRSGAEVVVVGRSADSAQAALGELGTPARSFVGDASDPGTPELAIALCLEAFAGFHGLYHVAGGSGRKHGDGRLHEMTDEGWDYTLRLNLTSLMYSNRAAVRQFHAQHSGGSILNMGSVLGWSPSKTFFASHAYAASKSAVIGFTKSIAATYAADGIRCNVLAPALVETPMAKRAAEDETILQFIRTKQPLDGGRIGRADDLDAAAVYFLSDGSSFTTGQVLAVDGGWGVSEGQIPL